jgi:hypothetical protein
VRWIGKKKWKLNKRWVGKKTRYELNRQLASEMGMNWRKDWKEDGI